MRDIFGPLLGGRLCLDFVNTGLGRNGAALTSYAALAAWAVHSRTLAPEDARTLVATADRHPDDGDAVMARALSLRSALTRLCTTPVDTRPVMTPDLDVLNAELQVARSHERLRPSERRTRRHVTDADVPRVEWQWDARGAVLDCVLWPVAVSAAELITSADLERVGRCAADSCGRLFLDTSRGRRRQWCEMATCGNADKVRRFRQKRRSGPPGTARHSLP